MVKHKVLKDFQFLTPERKIIILKAKTILQNFRYLTKTENVVIEREIIENNPDYFSIVDWKEELTNFLKSNKIPQPAVISKKIVPFIEEMFVITGMSESIKDDNPSKSLELEAKTKRLDLKESQLNVLENELIQLESDLNRKEKILNQKEERLNLSEERLRVRELDLDALMTDTHRDLDTKQKEFNNKLEEKLREISDRENQLDLRAKVWENSIDKDDLKKRIEDIVQDVRRQGYSVDLLEQSMKRLI